MKKALVLILAIIVIALYLISPITFRKEEKITYDDPVIAKIALVKEDTLSDDSLVDNIAASPMTLSNPIYTMLHKKGTDLHADVINKILTILNCVQDFHIQHNPILTVIDYSLPANKKRLWVFDLDKQELLFHTYVSHGIKSGALLSNYFSNKYDSKTSSIGVYTTDKSYYGREGLSLKLNGLERGFNDHAYNRSLVMHGGWYLDEEFIKKYGRSGRSWGCPAVPEELAVPIINTIKDNTLFVVYYPSEQWLSSSKFLQCKKPNQTTPVTTSNTPAIHPQKPREDVLFASTNKDSAVIAMPADAYMRIFHAHAPLSRMLRRPIDKMEYIALSKREFEKLIIDNTELNNNVSFIIPVITMRRGYYATEMKRLNLGQIKNVSLNNLASNSSIQSYTVHFESDRSIQIKSTNHFVRWLGL